MDWTPSRQSALARLANFVPRAGRAYTSNRNHDDGADRANVSLLSPWLHAGLVSEAEVIGAILQAHGPSAADKFISEVFWRVYFKGYLQQRPQIWTDYCEGRDAALARLETDPATNDTYSRAIEGRTGIQAVDHWARELVETGYLQNHARMWFASIWIFTLKIDWRLGADFFLRHLLDGDAASNTLSWRWVGGLHTKDKIYLARRDNIARYTANHPSGPLEAKGLEVDASPLVETNDYARRRLDLPDPPPSGIFDQPYALLLHDEAASHVPLNLPKPPALVIGAARPEARTRGRIGERAIEFARGSVLSGLDEAANTFGCATCDWPANLRISDILDRHSVDRVIIPFLPVGWTSDALMPQIGPLAEAGRVVFLLNELNRATWPHAKAGFFGVKKKVDGILRELGIAGDRQEAIIEPPLP